MADIIVWVLSAVLSLFGPDPCWNMPAQIDVQTVSTENGWTVDITTVGCGSLYSSFDGVHGWLMTTYSEPPDTRTLRLPGTAAIDKITRRRKVVSIALLPPILKHARRRSKTA